MTQQKRISYFLSSKLKEELKSLLISNGKFSWHEHGDLAGSDLIVLDCSAIDKNQFVEILRDNAAKTIMISDQSDEFNFLNYISQYEINHLVGAGPAIVVEEIRKNVEFLREGEGCSLNQLVQDPEEFHEAVINDSKEVNNILEKMIGSLKFVDFFNSPGDYLKVLGNELILNAVYGAACDENGKSLYNQWDRKKQVKLEKDIEVKIAVDQHVLALSVKDFFGTLTRETLTKSLARSFKEKTYQDKNGGAGLGFYLVFNHANQLIVNVRPGKSTEVICIIDKNKRFKSYKKRITSFHFFNEVKL